MGASIQVAPSDVRSHVGRGGTRRRVGGSRCRTGGSRRRVGGLAVDGQVASLDVCLQPGRRESRSLTNRAPVLTPVLASSPASSATEATSSAPPGGRTGPRSESSSDSYPCGGTGSRGCLYLLSLYLSPAPAGRPRVPDGALRARGSGRGPGAGAGVLLFGVADGLRVALAGARAAGALLRALPADLTLAVPLAPAAGAPLADGAAATTAAAFASVCSRIFAVVCTRARVVVVVVCDRARRGLARCGRVRGRRARTPLCSAVPLCSSAPLRFPAPPCSSARRRSSAPLCSPALSPSGASLEGSLLEVSLMRVSIGADTHTLGCASRNVGRPWP